MKRFLSLRDRLMGKAIVQCDICGFIDPFEFAKNAPRWDEGKYNERDGWSHGANPNAHFCAHCTEVLYKTKGRGGFYRMVGDKN